MLFGDDGAVHNAHLHVELVEVFEGVDAGFELLAILIFFAENQRVIHHLKQFV